MPSMMITAEFNIGEIVYVKTDTHQDPCIITGINIRPGHLSYQVTRDELTSMFYDFELTVIKNIKAL